MTRVLTSGILFSTAVRAVVVAKFEILCISSLTLLILTLRAIVVAKIVISSILSSISLILAL